MEESRIKFRHFISRYEDILKILQKRGFLTLTEIQKELLNQKIPIEITIQGIKKNLGKMVSQNEAVYTIFKKEVKKIIKPMIERKLSKKRNNYYFATPKSGKLFRIISEKIENFGKDKYIPLIEQIIDQYQGLEIASGLLKRNCSREEVVRAALREENNKKNISKKTISLLQSRLEPYFKDKQFPEIKFKMPVKEILFNRDKYFLINDELVPVFKLRKFIDILDMDGYMRLLAYSVVLNKEGTSQMIQAMTDLFIEIVKDSQIKV